MRCPICHKSMELNATDESKNPKTGIRYARRHYVCQPDDVYITTEIPITQQPATIVYKNWRGETSERHIIPGKTWFGQTEWHKDDQWFLQAYDVDKQVQRDFALKDIERWC